MLTRLPAGLAVPAGVAADVLADRFAGRALALDAGARSGLLRTLAAAGVVGGATYNGLVALEAAAHGETLLTLDRRAEATYRRLGVAFAVIAG